MTLTDAEKTRRLAEGCMGWTLSHPLGEARFKDDKGKERECRQYFAVCWQPLHNEAHAAEVRERMRELGWWWEILTSDTRDHIALEHRMKGVRFTAGKVAPGAIPRGICHAALLALGLAKEEEL